MLRDTIQLYAQLYFFSKNIEGRIVENWSNPKDEKQIYEQADIKMW